MYFNKVLLNPNPIYCHVSASLLPQALLNRLVRCGFFGYVLDDGFFPRLIVMWRQTVFNQSQVSDRIIQTHQQTSILLNISMTIQYESAIVSKHKSFFTHDV